MIENCETPRSVDVTLQSLAGATNSLPRYLLVQLDVWTLIRRRLVAQDPRGGDMGCDHSYAAHARALQAISIFSLGYVGLDYGASAEAGSLEALTLGLQSCIDR